MVVTCARVEAGRFFTGERVEITADTFDRFGNFLGGAFLCAFEEEMLDEMADTVHLRRLITRTDANPKADADAGHVPHFGGGNGEAIGHAREVIHRRSVRT